MTLYNPELRTREYGRNSYPAKDTPSGTAERDRKHIEPRNRDSSTASLGEPPREQINDETSNIQKIREFDRQIAMFSAINNAVILAASIDFEDGIEDEYYDILSQILNRYGKPAVNLLELMIISNKVRPDIASTTLRYLGEIKHGETHQARYTALVNALGHPSFKVRDGAALGLAALKEPTAKSYLKYAIQNEHVLKLRQNMQMILDHLKG